MKHWKVALLAVLMSASSALAAGEGWHLYEKTNKPTPVSTDLLGIEDSADSFIVKNIFVGDLPVSSATQSALNLKADVSHTHAGVYVESEVDPTVNALGTATLSCSLNEIAKWNGSVWACAADNDTDTNTDDQTAAEVTSTATGDVSATNVQAAIAELASEKATVASVPTAASDLSDINTSGATSTSFLKYNGTDTWVPAAESDPTVNALGTATLACSIDQIPKYNGTIWACGDDTGGSSTDDQTAAEVPFTPTGNIAATDTQAAIAELDTEKASAASVPTSASDLSDINTSGATSTSFLKYNGTDTWVPAAESDPTVNTLAQTTLSCSTNEIPKYNGSAWACASDSEGTGTDDQVASEVPFTPAGDVAATDTQAAIAELDTEKAPKTGISIILGDLSTDLDVTLTDLSTSPLVDDTVTYGATDDDLRLWSAENVGSQLAAKAAIANVLVKTNTTAYTPSADYHPATKKYVDDNSTYNQTAAEVPFTPTGDIAATNVQAAIAELDTEKAPNSGISITLGDLSTDLDITLTDLSTSPLVDDTVSYGDTDDDLRLWSIEKTGAMIAAGGISAIGDIPDVDVTGVANGKILKYNSTSTNWEIADDTGTGGSSYVATPWTYSDETCTAGEYAIDTSYIYLCVASGNIDRIATTNWSNPTPTYPVVSSGTVQSDGTTVALTFDQTVYMTSYTTGDFDVDCTTAGSNLALSSPTGSGANWSFTSGTTINSGDSCDLDYTYVSNGIEDSTGDDLQTLDSLTLTVVGAGGEDWTPATIEVYEGSQAPAVYCNMKFSIYDSNGDLVAVTDGVNYSSTNTYKSDDVTGTPTDIVASSTYYLAITDDAATNTGCSYSISWATGASTYGRSSEGGTYASPADTITIPISTPYGAHDTPLARVKNAGGEILIQWTGTVGGTDNSLHYSETSAFEVSATSESSPQ